MSPGFEGAAVPYFWQIAQMVCIQQQLFKGLRIAQDLVGHGRQGAVALVNVLHLAVTSERDALKHGLGAGRRFTPHVIPSLTWRERFAEEADDRKSSRPLR